ncbi:hypothetical protein HFO56_24510 [Rhizobium laguerreae]|uniref:hypothetical protein n=1 Tax=Rhizobium laguerreae TaxID=1076926 RepID=UPI001C91B257|nr:hypothetical protein [Rhizobium laguerreae]MBY3155494.1 hypothetical protein [Rhizobium laguerreae]
MGMVEIADPQGFLPMALDRETAHRLAIDHFVGVLSGMDAQAPFGRFMLDHGSYHEAAPKPPRLKSLMPTRCYSNAQSAVVRAVSAGRKPLTYAEGYACPSTLPYPVQHAWLVDDEGRVVDQTWSFPEESTYFGVLFTTDYVIETATKYRHKYNSLLDDRRDRWALLNDPAIAERAVTPPGNRFQGDRPVLVMGRPA